MSGCAGVCDALAVTNTPIGEKTAGRPGSGRPVDAFVCGRAYLTEALKPRSTTRRACRLIASTGLLPVLDIFLRWRHRVLVVLLGVPARYTQRTGVRVGARGFAARASRHATRYARVPAARAFAPHPHPRAAPIPWPVRETHRGRATRSHLAAYRCSVRSPGFEKGCRGVVVGRMQPRRHAAPTQHGDGIPLPRAAAVREAPPAEKQSVPLAGTSLVWFVRLGACELATLRTDRDQRDRHVEQLGNARYVTLSGRRQVFEPANLFERFAPAFHFFNLHG